MRVTDATTRRTALPGLRRRGAPASRLSRLLARLAANDPEHAAHGRLVGQYAHTAARELGLPATTGNSLRLAGELHDVGKLEMPRRILEKPGPLDEREWALIRTHPAIGASLIRRAGLDRIAGWVLAHHERPDGRGYPYALKANRIPVEAAVLAVADAFHAMTTDRPYQGAVDIASAFAELRRGCRSQFDAFVVDAFIPSVQRSFVGTGRR